MTNETMPLYPGAQYHPAVPVPPKHSMLGVASFIISIFVGFLIFGTILIAGVMEAATPGSMNEESPAAVIVGCGIILFLALDVVALALGIAGLFQKYCKKIFAILGTVFSGMAVLGTVVLIIIGLLFG